MPDILPTAERAPTFLEELESRQDDAIAQLDELNLRIEQLLNEWTGKRQADAGPDAEPVAA